MSDRLPGPAHKARLGQYADARIADATGQDFDQYNQGWGDWMWEKGKGAGQALNQPLTAEDMWDLMKSVPSAGTRIGESLIGLPGDLEDMKWSLANLINQGQRKLTDKDFSLELMRGRGMGLGDMLPTSEDVHETAKEYLPGALTHEPQGLPGQLLHGAADFVELGGPAKGALKYGRKLLK